MVQQQCCVCGSYRALLPCNVALVECDSTQGLIELLNEGLAGHWAGRTQHTRSLCSNLGPHAPAGQEG
jgi:hypothetical protein